MVCPCKECNPDPTVKYVDCHGGKPGYPHGPGGLVENTPFSKLTVDDAVDIVLTTDTLARRIGHTFVLDESKLRGAGFSQKQIGEIRLRTNKWC